MMNDIDSQMNPPSRALCEYTRSRIIAHCLDEDLIISQADMKTEGTNDISHENQIMWNAKTQW